MKVNNDHYAVSNVVGEKVLYKDKITHSLNKKTDNIDFVVALFSKLI